MLEMKSFEWLRSFMVALGLIILIIKQVEIICWHIITQVIYGRSWQEVATDPRFRVNIKGFISILSIHIYSYLHLILINICIYIYI